ncbi:MAG: hypothetical protein K8R48_06785 [Alphaproteobacteria bacterium]|nr:hypothetical protein [Alphaproteobacteria bacterium]
MRAFLSIAALCGLLFLPALSLAEEAVAPDLQDSKYYSCTTEEDCAIARTPCGGSDAVNKEYLEELQNWFDLQAKLVKCRQQQPDRPQVKALHCTEGRCAVEMTEPANPESAP